MRCKYHHDPPLFADFPLSFPVLFPSFNLWPTMWRRTYLLLLLVRFYFAISPSYIHPDENFQGPEVIAGESDSSSLIVLLLFDTASDVPTSSATQAENPKHHLACISLS